MTETILNSYEKNRKKTWTQQKQFPIKNKYNCLIKMQFILLKSHTLPSLANYY